MMFQPVRFSGSWSIAPEILKVDTDHARELAKLYTDIFERHQAEIDALPPSVQLVLNTFSDLNRHRGSGILRNEPDVDSINFRMQSATCPKWQTGDRSGEVLMPKIVRSKLRRKSQAIMRTPEQLVQDAITEASKMAIDCKAQ